jgi:group II intron reverse transcriptase/maturase
MLARNNPGMAFTSLNHYIDYEWMQYAYECTRKDGAVGVDGRTAEEYAANLQQNLLSLMDRLKSGHYQAPPVRRHYIPKSDGSGKRGLGIPCFEDKVAQRAIVMLLEPIYEQTFFHGSYGFRPGRSAHQALQAVRSGVMERRGRWVLDVDVRKYFDSIDKPKLREFLAGRVTDGVVRRLIDKWLKAGVLEDGELFYPETGTPQGGVISPCLANIFLHYVLDEWYSKQVEPRLKGKSTLVRYCDDFVMIFEYKSDAERVYAVLGKRLEKFGLQLHPDKTQLVDFRFRTPINQRKQLAKTFNFLGFSHVRIMSKNGKRAMLQKTAKDRLARTIDAFTQQCRRMRHWLLREQHERLCRMLRGHYAYYGITGNRGSLNSVHHEVARVWHKWLSRRSRQNSSHLSWEAFCRILETYPLPKPKIVHQYVRP